MTGEDVYGAVSDLLQRLDPGSMVTRFVAVVEVVSGDGERSLWVFNAPDAKPWDTLGLLTYASGLDMVEESDE